MNSGCIPLIDKEFSGAGCVYPAGLLERFPGHMPRLISRRILRIT
jgi:hypothetical protein